MDKHWYSDRPLRIQHPDIWKIRAEEIDAELLINGYVDPDSVGGEYYPVDSRQTPTD